jgi:hypothetical protein
LSCPQGSRAPGNPGRRPLLHPRGGLALLRDRGGLARHGDILRGGGN